MSEIPEGLHPLQYGHWLAEQCGWPPVKSTIELFGDCVSSVAKKKKLPLHQATWYIARAIKLAEEQRVKVDRLFFMDGAYMTIRPLTVSREYKPLDKAATQQEQATPEWIAASERARVAWAKLAGKTMESK